MRKMLLALLGFSLLFAACNKDETLIGGQDASKSEANLYALKYLTTPTQQGAALKYKLWEAGQTIKIKFLNGTVAQQTRIQDFAEEWTEYANLTFEYVTSGDADVKIGFKFGGDNVTWSYIGTDAKATSQGQPSMNFGGFISTAASTKRDVLMMFGHMLGLVNEHQSLGSDIPWDVPVVYEYYIDYEGWTETEVNSFFFQPYSSVISNYTEYDPLSIMVWPIEDFLTTDGVGVPGNSVLSDMDKQFIGELYPFDEEKPLIIMKRAGNCIVSAQAELAFCGEGKITIDWGDGTTEVLYTDLATFIYANHTYGDCSKDYTIKVYGDKHVLQQLICSNNALTELLFNVDMTNLTRIYCGGNPVCYDQSALYNLVESLPNRIGLSERGTLGIGNPVPSNSVQNLCAEKGWNYIHQ